MKRLIGDERAQRVDEHARPTVEDRFADRVDVEDERFAAPRAHDGERVAPALERIEGLDLRPMGSRGPNEGMHERARELVVGELRQGGAALGIGRNGQVATA